jgi:hypothetical protein
MESKDPYQLNLPWGGGDLKCYFDTVKQENL